MSNRLKVAAIAVSSLALVGCSHSSSNSKTSSPSTRVTDAFGDLGVTTSTVPSDAALAGMITVGSGDVPPGWHMGAPVGTPLVRLLEFCGHPRHAPQTGEQFSTPYTSGPNVLIELALVTLSRPAAAKVYAAVTGPVFESCAQTAVTKQETANATSMPVPSAGDQTSSVAISVSSTSQVTTNATHVQVAWALTGRVVVCVGLQGPGQPDQSVLRTELQAMVDRARKLAS